MQISIFLTRFSFPSRTKQPLAEKARVDAYCRLELNKMTTRKEYVFKIINGIPIAADVYFRKTTTSSKLPIGAQTT
jgi:hypothetical protein